MESLKHKLRVEVRIKAKQTLDWCYISPVSVALDVVYRKVGIVRVRARHKALLR